MTTAAEVIAALQQLPPDVEMVAPIAYDGDWGPIDLTFPVLHSDRTGITHRRIEGT